jgi:hypothetical protein
MQSFIRKTFVAVLVAARREKSPRNRDLVAEIRDLVGSGGGALGSRIYGVGRRLLHGPHQFLRSEQYDSTEVRKGVE